MITRSDKNQVWDSEGNLISEEDVVVDVTIEAITYDLHDRIRQALGSNQTWLDRSVAPTNAEAIQQIDRLTRQVNGLVRLLIGEDLLVENTDT